jgi:NADPH2:quinone reductase
VCATGVSFANTLVLSGKHQNTPELPFIPGTEIAGTIHELGADAPSYLQPGMRVACALSHGGFAQYATCDSRFAFPLPDELDFASATLFPTLYGTSFSALQMRAAVQPGEWVVVFGAAGGTGTTAVEVSKCLGAQVIACASNAEKRAAALAIGADVALDSRDGRLLEAIMDATRGEGADVVFDPVAGALFEPGLKCLKPHGAYVVIGFAGGAIPQPSATLLNERNVRLLGLYWGYYLAFGRYQRLREQVSPIAHATMRQLFDWYVAGALKPRVWQRLPLDEFEHGLSQVSGREVIGKIVLEPHGPGVEEPS